MKKFFLGVLILFISLNVYSGQAQVNWVTPEKYTDIKAGDNENQMALQKSLFNLIEKQFNEFSKTNIPINHTLAIAIYDVDLAGSVQVVSANQTLKLTRVINESTPPFISLGYIVIDNNNNTEIKSGTKLLTIKNFRTRAYKSNLFGHEKYSIKQWLTTEF
jgi:hypothetical protein